MNRPYPWAKQVILRHGLCYVHSTESATELGVPANVLLTQHSHTLVGDSEIFLASCGEESS